MIKKKATKEIKKKQSQLFLLEKHEKARQIYCIYFLDYGFDSPAIPVTGIMSFPAVGLVEMRDIKAAGDKFICALMKASALSLAVMYFGSIKILVMS